MAPARAAETADVFECGGAVVEARRDRGAAFPYRGGVQQRARPA